MTTLVLGAAGAIVGGMIGGPVGAQIGWLAGSMLGSLLDPPKVQGPKLQDTKIQRASYGNFIPFWWGTGRLAGTIVDQTDWEEHEEKSGGKGGPEVTNYVYSCSLRIVLGAARVFGEPVARGIKKCWANGRLIWSDEDGTDCPFLFYDGNEGQGPDSTFEAIHGIGEDPHYRGVASVVFPEFYGTDYGNVLPLFEFLVYTGEGDKPQQVTLGRELVSTPNVPNSYSYSLVNGEVVVISAYIGAGFMDVWVSKYDLEWNQILAPVLTTIPNAGIVGSNINGVDQIFTSIYGIGWWTPNPVGFMVQVGPDISVEWLASNNGTSGGNYGVSQNGHYFSFRALSPTYLNRWTPGGGHTAQTLVGAMNPNGCSLGTSDDGHIYVCLEAAGNAELFKYDEDLNLVYHWTAAQILADLGPTHPMHVAGTRGNFFVYKNQIAYNKQVGTNVWVALVDIGAAPGYVLSDTTHELAQASTGRIAHLAGALCMQINIGIFTLEPPAAGVPLSTIVGNLSDMTPNPIAYDASDLASYIVRWFVMGSLMTKRNALLALRPLFPFDAVESDDVAKFRRRYVTPIASIPDGDLGAREPGEKPRPLLQTIHAKESSLARRVTLNYIDVDTDYGQGSQSSPTQTTGSDTDTALDCPVGLTATEARQTAEMLQSVARLELETFKFWTGRKWAKLEPGDVVTVRGRVVRIEAKNEKPNGVIEWGAALAAPSEYSSDATNPYIQPATGSSGDGFIPPTPPGPKVATTLLLIDCPLVRDTDAPNGHYAAVYPSGPGAWSGAGLYKSVDGGTTYNAIGESSTADTVGIVAAALPDYLGGNSPDEQHKITVQLITPGKTLESVTDVALLNGANACLLGTSPGAWEILQYRTATLIAPDTYELTGLLRGRRGTRNATATHGTNEYFIALPTKINVLAPTAELNALRKFKAATFGTALADATAQDFANTGNALKPYPPTHLEGGRNAAGDLLVNAFRGTRIGGTWLEGAEVPLSEASEQYRLTVYSDGTYTTVKSTLGASAMPLVYNAVSQATDFGSLQAVVYLDVQQIGAYGPGFRTRGAL